MVKPRKRPVRLIHYHATIRWAGQILGTMSWPVTGRGKSHMAAHIDAQRQVRRAISELTYSLVRRYP